ncbi:cytochrome P450 [Xanthomonas populi]|uniref:cytochrome P450 n=1 Tax=Xanthomonas populi TaxID=53414 RepID=UPI001FC90EFB|nr:cytochrome P450 [Xanthomonas populi]
MDLLRNPLNRRLRLRQGIPVVPGAFPLVGHLPAIVCDLPRLLLQAEHTLGSHFWLDFGPAGQLMTCVDPDAFALLRHKDVSSALIEEIAPELLGGRWSRRTAARIGRHAMRSRRRSCRRD